MTYEAAFTSGPADVGEESQRYDGGLLYGPPAPLQPVSRPPVPACSCRVRWFTLYRGRRGNGACIRCGGAT